MNKKRILGIIGAIALVVLGVLIWILIRPDRIEPGVIKYGYLPIASDASFFVAVEHGFFTSQGLQVEPIKFQTSNQALEALESDTTEEKLG